MAAKVSKARQAGESVGKLVGAVAVLGIVGTLATVFLGPVVGSMLNFNYRMSYYQNNCDTQECVRSGFSLKPASWGRQIEASHEQSAPAVCPAYLDGSIWSRWVTLRELSWCAQYPQYASKN